MGAGILEELDFSVDLETGFGYIVQATKEIRKS